MTAERRARLEPRPLEITGRVPPHSVDAEAALLGSALVDGHLEQHGTFALHADLLPEAFYRDAHQHIWRAMRSVFASGLAVDLVSVTNALRGMNRLDDAGGVAYLTGLGDRVPTSAHSGTYAMIVREKYTLRQLLQRSLNVARRCYEEDGTLEEIQEDAAALAKIDGTGRIVVLDGDAVEDDAIAQVEAWRDSGGNTSVVRTEFYDLDEQLVGLERGSLNILAARPSMGKSAMAQGVGNNVALAGGHVAIATLEMPARQFALRMLASAAKVPLQKLRDGTLSADDVRKLREAREARRGLHFSYIEDGDLTVGELRRRVVPLHAVRPLSLLIVDYLQLMRGQAARGDSENRQQEISSISRALKALARELDIPLLVLSQLSRKVEERPNHRPMLSDLRESGAIEQDADVVMFIYRDEYYNPNSDLQGIAEIIIGKQRNGPVGTVKLGYDADSVNFYNIAARPFWEASK